MKKQAIDKKEMLGKAPLGRLLFKLAVPTVIAQLINMLYNIVDRIYIGHMPSNADAALTGIGVCLPIIMIVSAFAALVGTGGGPRCSIFMGKKQYDQAEKTIGNCFAIQIVISVLLTTILLIWNKPMLLAFGASNDTIEFAHDYMTIYSIGTLFVQLTLGMNVFISAQGFTFTSMISVLIGAVLNIALDPIFIFAANMGVQGAALATIISQFVSTIWVLGFLFFSKKAIIKIKWKNIRLSPKIIGPCLLLGSATFIMQASESIVFICFNSSLQGYGGDISVGAMTIFSSVMQFAMLPLQGIGQGAQPIISYNYGAKNVERVKKTFWLLLASSLTYSTILYLAIMIFPNIFSQMFTENVEYIAFATKYMRIFFAVLILFGVQMACQMAFVSIGNAIASIVVAVVRKFVLLIPLIYIMPAIMEDNVLAVYLAEPIADGIAVTFTAILFAILFSKALKKLRIEKQQVEQQVQEQANL